MHSSSFLLTLIATLAAARPQNSTPSQNVTVPSSGAGRAPVNSLANNADVVRQLLTAPRAVDRFPLIPLDSDYVFDFLNPPPNTTTRGMGGQTVAASRFSFPPLVGSNTAMTVGFIGPCGFNTPHTHPRSAEINICVEGRLSTQFVLENGARTVTNDLLQFQMTSFPMGAIHTEFNPDCTPATFVAGFASEDPGVAQEAQSFLGLDPAIVEAAIGNGFAYEGRDVAQFRDLIPANVALGVEACLRKCNITPAPAPAK